MILLQISVYKYSKYLKCKKNVFRDNNQFVVLCPISYAKKNTKYCIYQYINETWLLRSILSWIFWWKMSQKVTEYWKFIHITIWFIPRFKLKFNSRASMWKTNNTKCQVILHVILFDVFSFSMLMLLLNAIRRTNRTRKNIIWKKSSIWNSWYARAFKYLKFTCNPPSSLNYRSIEFERLRSFFTSNQIKWL